jgi:hypothetical protein
MFEKTTQFIRLRAACALLILLIGGPLAPFVSAAAMGVDCSMACCVEDGYCCCNKEDSEEHTFADSPEIGGAQIVKRCPDDCAATGQVSRLQSRDSLRAAPYIVGRAGPKTFRPNQHAAATSFVGATSFAPRAPPALHSASSSVA